MGRERERASCSCEQRPQELYNFHKRTHRTLLNLKSIIILNLILYHTIRHLQHMNEPKKKTTKTKRTHTVKRTGEKQQRTQTRLLSVARIQLNVSTLKESRRHDSIARTCCCNATQRSRCLISHLNFFFCIRTLCVEASCTFVAAATSSIFSEVFLCFAHFPLIFHSLLDFYIQLCSTSCQLCALLHSAPTIDLLIIAAFYSQFVFFSASCLIPSVDRCDGSDSEMERKSVREKEH